MKSYETERERKGFAKRLYDLRQERKITQGFVAEALKVKCSTYGKWETNERKPDFNQIIKLSRFFKTTSDYLLTGIQPKYVDIHRAIGLSDSAIENLRNIKAQKMSDESHYAPEGSADRYFESLSKALSSRDFVCALATYMDFKEGEPGYHYDSVFENPFYLCHLSPDSYKVFLSTQITLILNTLAKGDEIPIYKYAPFDKLLDKTIEELRTQGRLIEKGDAQNGKETR